MKKCTEIGDESAMKGKLIVIEGLDGSRKQRRLSFVQVNAEYSKDNLS